MTFKKTGALILTCMLLIIPSLSFTNAIGNENGKSGMLNVDELIKKQNQIETSSKSLFRSNNELKRSPQGMEYAGGGTFWVEFGLELEGYDAFGSYYFHARKYHRSTAANTYETIRSKKTRPGKTAEAIVHTTHTGNRAFWYVY